MEWIVRTDTATTSLPPMVASVSTADGLPMRTTRGNRRLVASADRTSLNGTTELRRNPRAVRPHAGREGSGQPSPDEPGQNQGDKKDNDTGQTAAQNDR